MKQTIRLNTFETNSSSLHSLTILSKEDFDKFKSGEYFLKDSSETAGQLITKEEAYKELFNEKSREEYEKEYKEWAGLDDSDEIDDEQDFLTYVEGEQYSDATSYKHLIDESDYQTYEYGYTTKNGDEIVVFGYYGEEY